MNYFVNINIFEPAFLLDILSYLSIISGILVITAKNPIVSILYLIGLFINVAIYLEVYGLNLIGLIYILVYVGAIAILLLFIIMLLNIKISELHESGNGEDIPLATIMSISYIYVWYSISKNTYEGVIGNASSSWLTNLKSTIDELILPVSLNSEYFLNKVNAYNVQNLDSIIQDYVSLGTIKELNVIGEIFYTEYAFNLIIISIILLLSIITAIVVTRNSVIIKE